LVRRVQEDPRVHLTDLSQSMVRGQDFKKAATQTELAVNAGTLAQPITFTVAVRAPVAAGSPMGTVNLTTHGTLLQTLTLSPATSSSSRFAVSEATFTVIPQPGGAANYFGKYNVKATFVPGGAFSGSSASKNFTVSQPGYTALANGVEIATVASGSGPQIQSGQTANVLYTGYLAKNGQIFDDSDTHGGAPLSFVLGAGQLIPGFDAGTAGMRVGETRIIVIPPRSRIKAARTGRWGIPGQRRSPGTRVWNGSTRKPARCGAARRP